MADSPEPPAILPADEAAPATAEVAAAIAPAAETAPRAAGAPETVYVKVAGGKVHIVYRGRSGRLHPFEGCNLDDARDAKEISEADALAAPVADRCRNDFRDYPAQED